ncbi:MAG: GreA/GreB family elongation factor [Anaeromyxobacter sp.]|nr:GreA/GreB family elongation factor [Anaeromyxobacter sp.]MBL0277162.1 GreA/GreB family elongation factor [Anaeromyxobacter sp.]
MSKAFTSEESPDEPPLVRALPRLAPGEVRYVTPEGQAALRGELEAARSSATPEGAARAARLEATLATLTVLGPDAAPEGVAAFGRWITTEDEAGVRTTWRLVGPDEADARRGALSVHAPTGRALLGHAAGDEVEVRLPGGVKTLLVVAVAPRAPGT